MLQVRDSFDQRLRVLLGHRPQPELVHELFVDHCVYRVEHPLESRDATQFRFYRNRRFLEYLAELSYYRVKYLRDI